MKVNTRINIKDFFNRASGQKVFTQKRLDTTQKDSCGSQKDVWLTLRRISGNIQPISEQLQPTIPGMTTTHDFVMFTELIKDSTGEIDVKTDDRFYDGDTILVVIGCCMHYWNHLKIDLKAGQFSDVEPGAM